MTSTAGNGREAKAGWSLRLLGEFERGELPDGTKVALPGNRERLLLAYLAVHPKCRESRRKLTTLLWREDSDETTLDNLRNCVFNLRKALGTSDNQVVASDGRDITLDISAFDIDVVEFWNAAAKADITNLQRAAQLYGGKFL